MHSYNSNNSYWSTTDIHLFQLKNPKEAQPSGPPKPGNKIFQAAIFREDVSDEERETVIYNSRSAYIFKTKMAIDADEKISLCNTGINCCPTQTRHFYVMPRYTPWVSLGDLGVIINLALPEQPAVYAICGDFGPDKSVQFGDKPIYKGRLGEGSVELGRCLKINGWNIGDGTKAYQLNGILYIVFPNTGITIYESGKMYTTNEIAEKAHEVLKRWGGWPYVQYIAKEAYGIDLND